MGGRLSVFGDIFLVAGVLSMRLLWIGRGLWRGSSRDVVCFGLRGEGNDFLSQELIDIVVNGFWRLRLQYGLLRLLLVSLSEFWFCWNITPS